MEIREVICKTALSVSRLPGLDYSLNPYRGCQHGCLYCYAPNILRVERKKWGCIVEVKTNIPNVLSKELKSKKPGVVALSTVTDPYQPLEKKYKLSKYCLEQLLKVDFPVSIQTKSNLILRDIDLISSFSDREVLITIGTLDDNLRKKLEPCSSSVDDRLEVLKSFSDIGVKTTVFFGPIYPNVNLSDIQKYVEVFMENGTSEILFDKFNLKPGILENLSKTIPQYKSVIKNVDYYNKLYDEIKRVCSYKFVKATSAF